MNGMGEGGGGRRGEGDRDISLPPFRITHQKREVARVFCLGPSLVRAARPPTPTPPPLPCRPLPPASSEGR